MHKSCKAISNHLKVPMLKHTATVSSSPARLEPINTTETANRCGCPPCLIHHTATATTTTKTRTQSQPSEHLSHNHTQHHHPNQTSPPPSSAAASRSACHHQKCRLFVCLSSVMCSLASSPPLFVFLLLLIMFFLRLAIALLLITCLCLPVTSAQTRTTQISIR